MLIPTDLASFLELIRQNGDVAYSLMFAYASGHSLLFAMFAGYAAHSGALSVGPLIAACWLGSFTGDVVRFWIGRKFGTRWPGSFPRLERAANLAAQMAARHHVWMILFHRYPHGIRGVAGFAYGMSPLSWADVPGPQRHRGRTLGVCGGVGRPRVRTRFGKGHVTDLVRPWRRDADRVPRRVVDPQQEARASLRARLTHSDAMRLP